MLPALYNIPLDTVDVTTLRGESRGRPVGRDAEVREGLIENSDSATARDTAPRILATSGECEPPAIFTLANCPLSFPIPSSGESRKQSPKDPKSCTP